MFKWKSERFSLWRHKNINACEYAYESSSMEETIFDIVKSHVANSFIRVDSGTTLPDIICVKLAFAITNPIKKCD